MKFMREVPAGRLLNISKRGNSNLRMKNIIETSGPLVSVLVPVFNVERYVSQALESIAKQSHRNLQVLVVDDCSTDRTRMIVEEFCDRDPRFQLIRNPSNLRIVKALNRALERADGAYIARCDGDDIMELDRIERQLAYLSAHPEVDLVGCSLKFIDENNLPITSYAFPSGTEITRRLLRYSTAVSHIWLAKRHVYENAGPYRIPTVEDYDFLLRADLAGYKLDNIPGYYGMQIRIRRDNTVGKYGIVQRKLFNYARVVNRAERSGDKNFYSEHRMERIIEEGRSGVLAKMHYFSDRLSYAASLNRSVVKYGLIVLAALLSPYKFQYYLNATLREMIVRQNRSRMP
jgi:glycosyltransferase involved in cell wall biosynthesis